MNVVYLLSPARCGGARAQVVLREQARFDLAERLRAGAASLGEVFTFMSGLYFRGKLAYATRFAAPPEGCPGVLVITPDRGLLSPDTRITHRDLRAFARVPIDAGERRYVRPFREAAEQLRTRLGERAEVVLLGSIATPKYVELLLAAFGARLLFPGDFVGRGDMSRGGLLLRAARAGSELAYRPVDGATRHGARPARLPPLPRAARIAPAG